LGKLIARKKLESDAPNGHAVVAFSQESERRREIMRAAIEVFSKKGFQGCRIADVAREAGVAYGLVYHYFKNKDELLESVFTNGWTVFLEQLERAIHVPGSLEVRVRAIVAASFEAYRRDPKTVKVLILEVGRSPAGGAVNRGDAFAQAITGAAMMFSQAKADGELAVDLDCTLCATLLFGAIEMGLTSFVLGLLDRRNESLLKQAQEQVAHMYLFGLKGRP
jgi:TetR/AcrR family transcriptional regulator, fatty acid metabolism regulator protein